MKTLLDTLVNRYKTPDFIEGDPIRFPHRFREMPHTAQWVGFLAALFSYGRRDKILETLDGIFHQMDGDPQGFLEGFNLKRDQKLFKNFVYRFNRGDDLVFLLSRLQWIHQEFETLENFFLASGKDLDPADLKSQISAFVANFLHPIATPSNGIKFLLADPKRGGACKRFHMFLRWMVRDDAVDLGLWKKTLSPAQLMVPLDTHVAQMARELGFTHRKANDWQTAEEITAIFRQYSPEDPVQYDFALFGLGITKDNVFQEPIMSAGHTLGKPSLGQGYRLRTGGKRFPK